MIQLKNIKHCASPSLAQACKQYFGKTKCSKQNHMNCSCKKDPFKTQAMTIEKEAE